MKSFLKISLASIFLYQNAYSKDLGITQWREERALKGYILSIDLKNKNCKNIWNDQIKAFKSKNPKIKNPNVIKINQSITVQSCVEIREEKKEEVVQQPVKLVESKKDSSISIALSGQSNSVEEKDNDSSKNGRGVKLEISQKIDSIKASAGFLFNKTEWSKNGINLSSERLFLTADFAYLFKFSRLQLGPDLGLLFNSKNATFKDIENRSSEKVSPYLGLNLNYSLSEHFSIDSKILNKIESRQNTNLTIGLEYKF